MKITCHIPIHPISYDIEIEENLFLDEKKIEKQFQSIKSRISIVTCDDLISVYGDKLRSTLLNMRKEVFLFSFPSGEKYKTRETKEILENKMLEKGLGRDTTLVALGGGVVTDLVGFLAATYCRGIPLIMIPTTLLGMVDASIGGKSGVDTPYGKNLIGSIYQPSKVLIDPAILKTLPAKELRNGIVEMIKHGLIYDSSYFDYLEDNLEKLISLDPKVLEYAIFESIRIKKEIVEHDEKEKGMRFLLNCGHTIGHALERISDYSLPHGEAVAIGILCEGYMAKELGHLDESSFNKIYNVLKKCAPLKLSFKPNENDLFESMKMDKKAIGGKPRFVILEKIGKPCHSKDDYCVTLDDVIVKNGLRWMINDLLCS